MKKFNRMMAAALLAPWLTINFPINLQAADDDSAITTRTPTDDTVTDATDGDDALEEVRVTGQLSRFSALKSDALIVETARSISIETEQQIIDKGALDLDDVYVYSAGVIGQTYGFATRGDWVKVRGLDVPQYQDSLQSLFGNYNNTRPDIYTLEQVEILKGPASVLFGKGSPGGLVNVISKRPRERAHHEVVTELGNFDRRQVAVDSTGAMSQDGDWLYRFVGVYRDTDTQVDFVGEETRVLAPSITWRPSDFTNLTLLLNHTDTDSDTGAQFLPIHGTLLPAPNGAFIDSDVYLGDPEFNRYDTTTTSVTLLADHDFTDTWSMEFTSRYTEGSADYQQAWPAFIGGTRYVFEPDGTLYEGGKVPRSWYRSDASSEQIAADVRFRADFDLGAWQHSVQFGAQYQDVTTNDDGYYAYALGYDFATSGPAPPFGDAYWIDLFEPVYGNVPPADFLDSLYADNPENETRDYGFYVNDHVAVGRWRFTLGLRFDDVKNETAGLAQKDDAISGAAAVLYQFDNGVAPYVSYAESFEPVVGDNGAGEPLEPQEGEQLEVGIKYQPRAFPGLLTLAWFDIEQSNLPDPTGLPGEFEQQRGVAKIRGVEFEGIAVVGNFTVEMNLSKLDTESPNGFRLASVPEDQASAWVTWRPEQEWAGFRMGAGVRYVGESWGGRDVIRTPSYTVGDLMIGYGMQHWDFQLNVHNLSDEDYMATCLARGDCFPGAQRTVVGTVRYLF